LLTNKAIFIYCAILLIITTAFRLIPQYVPGVLGYASSISVKDLLTLTNQKRKEQGLSELRLNATLSEAAKKKAQDMFEEQYWAHISPSGKEPWDFILGEKYDYIYAGENLAKNFSTSKDVVDAWYKSPSHRENLMSANYDEMGFAIVNGILDGYETTLVVQMFGRPRSPGQVASVYEEEEVIKESIKVAEESPVISTTGAPSPIIETPTVLPIIDIATATKAITIGFAGFITVLLSLDIWYSRKKGIAKVKWS
jgi:uncharacterized protein YkwD